jgi:WhiB family redox-sensing transcriptional regulator
VVTQEWLDRAACRGRTDVDFDGPMAWPDALAICGRCPVRIECLRWALDRHPDHDYGILAGTTAADRHLIRHGRLEARQVWAEQGYPCRKEEDDGGGR